MNTLKIQIKPFYKNNPFHLKDDQIHILSTNKNEEEIKNVIDYLYKKFPNMTLNTIQIDLQSENGYFEENIYDSIVSYVLDYKETLIDVNSTIDKINDNNKLSEYNFFRYGSLPILFITARNYRIPLPSSIIYKFL